MTDVIGWDVPVFACSGCRMKCTGTNYEAGQALPRFCPVTGDPAPWALIYKDQVAYVADEPEDEEPEITEGDFNPSEADQSQSEVNSA